MVAGGPKCFQWVPESKTNSAIKGISNGYEIAWTSFGQITSLEPARLGKQGAESNKKVEIRGLEPVKPALEILSYRNSRPKSRPGAKTEVADFKEAI